MDTPTNFQGVSTLSTKVDLSWNVVSGATQYQVERSSDEMGLWLQIGTPTGPSFSDTAVTPNSTYYYRVRAAAGANVSNYTSAISVTTVFGAPTLTAAGQDGQVHLSWFSTIGATGYVIKRKAPGEGSFSTLVTLSSATLSYDDTTVTNGQTYQYTLSVQNTGGTGDPSSSVSAVPALPYITAVSLEPGGQVGGANLTARVTLSYAARTVAADITAVYSTNLSGPATVTIPLNASSGTFTVTTAGVATASPETVTLQRPNQTDVQGRVTLFPLAIAQLTATPVGATAVELTWTAISGATTYVLERRLDASQTWTTVTQTGQQTFMDSTVQPLTAYRYRVRGAVSGAIGLNSAEVSVTTLGTTPPALIAPLNVAVEDDFGDAVVTWRAQQGTYRVWRSTAIAGPWTLLASGLTETEYRDATAQIGGAYAYVVATERDGTVGPQSSPVLVTINGNPGKAPSSGLTLWGTSFLGTTSAAGRKGGGAIISYSTSGAVTERFAFGDSVSLNLRQPMGEVYVVGNVVYGRAFGADIVGTALFTADLSQPAAFAMVDTPYTSSLISGGDGNLYGVTQAGGLNGTGSVFSVSSQGVITELYSFDPLLTLNSNASGAHPTAALTLGPDGYLYGATEGGGDYGIGVLFKISTAGQLTVLHHFEADLSEGTAVDGLLVSGPVAIKSSSIYVAFSQGGDYGSGAIAKFSLTGTLTQIVSLPDVDSAGVNTVGATPTSGLVDNGAGSFYLYTGSGGLNTHGTVVKVDTSLGLTSIWSFHPYTGISPIGQPATNSLGYLYGVLGDGGALRGGTYFQLSPTGVFTTFYNFRGGK